jgi:ethanolamine ammonia-lyase small subunit
MPVTSYSTTAANNNSAAPNGAPEGWAPSAVNDTIRQIMTDIAVEAQTNAVKVLASVAGTDTVTGSLTPDLTAYSAGMIVILTPANNNTGAATLSIFRSTTARLWRLAISVPASPRFWCSTRGQTTLF